MTRNNSSCIVMTNFRCMIRTNFALYDQDQLLRRARRQRSDLLLLSGNVECSCSISQAHSDSIADCPMFFPSTSRRQAAAAADCINFGNTRNASEQLRQECKMWGGVYNSVQCCEIATAIQQLSSRSLQPQEACNTTHTTHTHTHTHIYWDYCLHFSSIGKTLGMLGSSVFTTGGPWTDAGR